jgi:hypothetical protein
MNLGGTVPNGASLGSYSNNLVNMCILKLLKLVFEKEKYDLTIVLS